MKSLRKFLKRSSSTRRLLAFIFHGVGIVVSYVLAFQLRFDFDVSPVRSEISREMLPWIFLSYLGCLFAFGLYKGLWRFFTLRDCLITAIALSTGTLVAALAIFIANGFTFLLFPRSVLVICFLLLLLWEIGGRGVVRLYRESRNPLAKEGGGNLPRILMVGEPDHADVLLRSMRQNLSELGQVVGLVSEKDGDHGSKMRGIKIYGGVERVAGLVEKLDISTLLFLPPFTAPGKMRPVVDTLSEHKLGCTYRIVPSLDDIASGRLDVSGIRRVAIEDLLPRPAYDLDLERLRASISGKHVLVTGAGGSIGSELARQILGLQPSALVLFDSAEFGLFEIERELSRKAKESGVALTAVVGDVRQSEHLRRAMRNAGGIDILYHAAAYKHVDLMERNAAACFQNNVIGTQVAATVAEEEGVDHFVLVSTDKAVRPTSLMGASKRLAEKIVIESRPSKTNFKAVRFGNVLGSSGSVVPIFHAQIAAGGPVTVTSPEVTRFFMTIPEAVELILAAGAIEDDRRILVLEMGEAVKIDTLARKMIELSGFIPDVDIPISYTGLKPGEKEYEELLTNDENVARTEVDRIWVVKREEDRDAERIDIGHLFQLIDDQKDDEIREYVHSLIPESRLLESSKASV